MEPRRLALDDVDLEYWEAGSGPPLLALHGVLELPGWHRYLDLLSGRFRVVAPSHPGFGGSSRPDWMTTVDDLTNFYLDLIERLELDRPNLLGCSFGGWVAAELAVRNPERIRKLVLANALGLKPPGGPLQPAGGAIADWLSLAPDRVRALAWPDSAAGADALKLPGEENTSAEETIALIRNREAASVYGWKPFFHNPRLRHWLHRAGVPALVIIGDGDGIVPAAVGEAYAAGLPRARVCRLAGAGHVPQLERPDEFAGVVAAFLEES